MKIVVLLKQVPDTWEQRKIDLTTGLVDRAASDAVTDEVTERALEVALRHKDDADAEVVALTMGPEGASETLRKALAAGADSAVHVLDESLAGSDMRRTAEVLAAALRTTGFDLIITGNESTDGRGGVVPAMIAELLGVPHATFLVDPQIDASAVRGRRIDGHRTSEVSAALPAVLSVTEQAPEVRFPSFMGLRRAKKKPMQTLALSDLGVGQDGSRSAVVNVAQRPPRTAGKKVVDDGTAAEQLADFLHAGHLI